MDIELKACPFCGEGAFMAQEGTHAQCLTPGCCVGPVGGIDSWNTRAPQWQPIESAPKDGTKILVWNGYPSVAFWGPYSTWDDGDWHDDIDGVTHWMPILDPPEAPDGRG